MLNKLIPAALLIAGASVALAQNTPPAGGPGAQGGPGGGRPMMDPAARFKELDKNADGKLSLEEFQAMRGGRMGGGQGGPGGPGGAGGPPAGAPPGAAPPAGGGMGGMPGMMAAPADRFKAADTNHDGSLSVEEFTAMMQSMRGRMGGGGPGGAGGPGGPGGG